MVNGMSILVVFSLAVKAFGAVLEIVSQALISQRWSVETYGTYSFFVALAEIVFNAFFAGIVKFNNYYISQGRDVRKIKKGYYAFFTFPIVCVGMVFSLWAKNTVLVLACIAGFTYLLAMDSSSSLMSNGKYKVALIGEYTFGRVFLLLIIFLLSFFNRADVQLLYWAYIMQFVAVFIFYLPSLWKSKTNQPMQKAPPLHDAIKKYLVFQSTEISHTIVMQTSVIVQYIFGGAYQTALVSIVLVVRRLINFVSGPTSKLYQPEFSKRYAAGDKEGLARVYAQITRLQLCFMMPVLSFLIAAPSFLLKIYSDDLVGYGALVQITSLVFLYMIAFGPQSNFLSMTGNEKSDTISNWLSVVVMYLSMMLFKSNTYFVVIGFCVQILFCTTYKLVVYIRYMKKLPMSIEDYSKLLGITMAALVVMKMGSNSVLICLGVCLIQFIINFLGILPKEERNELTNKLMRKRKK